MATTTTSYGSITITEVQEGSQIWTTTVAPEYPSYTFTVSNLIGDSNASVKVGDIIMYSYYRYTVLSVSADGTTVFTGNRQGFASTVYQLIVSPVTVVKDKNGIYSPYYITLMAKSKTGTNTMGNYHGRFRIETTTDNENWEIQYTSTLNEPTVELDFSELDDIVALRCSLYASGGTNTLLDQQVISVVTDGVDGNDAYTVILTNENHTFAGNTTSAIASEIECNVIAYKGTTQIAATIGTITGQPTGMTTSLLNNGTVNAAFKVTVDTTMITKNGVLNVPVTVDGKSFTKEFTYTLTLDGEKGDKGDTAQWYYGELLTHTSGTATLPISQTKDVAVGSMYLNTKTGICYKCTAISGTNATWTYAGNITDGVEIGGRNLIRNSTNFDKWVIKNGGANGDIWSRSASGNTSNVNLRPRTWIGTGYLTDYYNKTLTISFEIMSPDWSAIKEGTSNTGLNGLAIQLETTASGIPYSSSIGNTGRYFFKRLGDKDYFKTDSDLVNGKWIKVISVPLKIDDTLWNNSTTLIDGYDYFTFSFILRRNGTISFRKPQIELGNKATDFTLAPEDIEADIEQAKKVATNYLSMDSTGIMVANMEDGEQTPSSIMSGRNVFIDNDSVGIRDGQNTLASFTGDNTKFYDPIYNKELATFGTSGAIIGANNEQRFVIEKDGIKSINDSGATVFSVNSTEGTVVTEAQVASGGESSYLSGKTVVFDTVGTGFTTNTTFYTKKLTAIIRIRNSAKPLTNVKVNSVTATSTLVDSYSGYWYSSTHSINLSPFTFTYGTSKRETYQITASFVNDYGDSYNLTAQASINYNGNVTLTVRLLTGECVRTSGNNEDIAIMDLIGSKIIYGEIYQSSAYTKAPAMTFGTRGKNAILAPFSVTIGEDLYANNDNQLSIGRYNLNDDEFSTHLAFAIGNGVNDIDRSNAFNVDWDGNVKNMGDLEVGKSLIINGSDDNIPNITINKKSTNTTDYIKCQDANLDAKFRVLHDGGVIVGNNLTVNGIITDFSNSYSTIKNLNVETFKLSTRTPVFRKTFYWTAEIGANSGWARIDTNVSLDGYTPVGVVSFGCFNASSGASSNVDWCVITKCYVWSSTLDVYVWNQNTGASARCGVYVKVLYVANGMI